MKDKSFLTGLIIGFLISIFAIFALINFLTTAKKIKLNELNLTTLEGIPLTSKELENKKIFLNIWATWCKPCIAEMPLIDSVYNELNNKKDWLFLLVSDEDINKIITFKNKHNYNFSFIRSETKFDDLGINIYPSTYIFNCDGILKFSQSGELDQKEKLKKILQNIE